MESASPSKSIPPSCLGVVGIRYEQDAVLARQQAREVAELLGFEARDQVQLATAVSEVLRLALLAGGRTKVEFWMVHEAPASFQVRVLEMNPRPAVGSDRSRPGNGADDGQDLSLLAARRLVDDFHVETGHNGTSVLISKLLPSRPGQSSVERAEAVRKQLARQAPRSSFDEVQRQNQELLSTLDELEKRQAELARLNKELEDTNRGVVALYAELDERADYLRRASDLKTQFLSNMTHEFRTPLNSILSLSRILLDRLDGDLSNEQEKQVRFIHKAASDLSELVNDLLDLAKVEAGKIAVRPSEFEVSALFGGLRGMLRPLLAHNSSIALQFEEPVGTLRLQTDESKISQILRNLVSNALKYTERGEVRVRAWAEPDGIAAFAVSDTGIGISAGDQDRIFQEFYQVEGPHQMGKKGTGLGLPLSRKLAELLGGTLTVESQAGQGSTFTLRVPAVFQTGGESTDAGEVPTELDESRWPILIVEDHGETLFAYDRFFQGTGYQVIPARTLKQARQALARVRPIAIILDILLEHGSAWDFLAELKAEPATRSIPVLVVTMVDNPAKAQALGADAFRLKPLDRTWLLGQLAQLCREPASEAVLVVDDDEASRYVLTGLLGNTRFRVLEAGNAREGLQIARTKAPAAIFLDLMLPDQSGFEFLQELRADPETRHLPVVVHTGKVLSREEEDVLAQETVAVLTKAHVDRAVSLDLIRDALLQARHWRKGTNGGSSAAVRESNSEVAI